MLEGKDPPCFALELWMLRLPVTVRLPRTWIAPPSPNFLATLWQSAKCISAEDWMKASSSKKKHGPNKDPEPFTESLPSKPAVFEKFSGALRSSVAPWWRTVSKNDPWQWWEDYKNIILSKLPKLQWSKLSHSQITFTKTLKLNLFFRWLLSVFFQFWSFKVPTTRKQHGKVAFLRFLPFELTLHGSKIASRSVTCRCDAAPQAISRV